MIFSKKEEIYFIHIASFWEYNEANFRISSIYYHKIWNKKWEILWWNEKWVEKDILFEFIEKLNKIIENKWKIIIWSNDMIWIWLEWFLYRIKVRWIIKDDNEFGRIENFLNNEKNIIILKEEIRKKLINNSKFSYIDVFAKNWLKDINIIYWDEEKMLHPWNMQNFKKIIRSIKQKWYFFIEIYNKFKNKTLIYPLEQKKLFFKKLSILSVFFWAFIDYSNDILDFFEKIRVFSNK